MLEHFFLHSWFRASLQLFQNNYQQDDTFGLSFLLGLVVLHSTCFELQGAHHQEYSKKVKFGPPLSGWGKKCLRI